MATVKGMTYDRMIGIENAAITAAAVTAGHLILTKKDGTTVDSGSLPAGPQGPAGPAGSSAGYLNGADAPYSLSSATGTQNANRTGLQLLIADAQAGGKIAKIPTLTGLIPLPPTDLLLDPNLGDLIIEAESPNAGFKQVADSSTNAKTIARTPLSGFAADGSGATPPAQNYWIFVDRTGLGNNAITWRNVKFQGGHGTSSAVSNPNAGESTWTQWGIGLRIPRRSRLYNTDHGGSWAGIQFDGDYDHTYCENVASQGNWINCRFGPRQNEKDNIFVNCAFANSSYAGISVAPTGFLGGSSWFGGHLGTQPCGIVFEHGTKSSNIGIQLQNMNFSELIWEGCGNYKIFCVDGDTRLDNAQFLQAQWHGLEIGDHSNIHTYYTTTVSNLARDSAGIVTATVTTIGSLASPLGTIAVGDYIVMNGVGSQAAMEGIKVGGGGADKSLFGVYQVLTVVGTVITMQGFNTNVVASGAVSITGAASSGTAYLSRVGAVRAGKVTGAAGFLQVTGDEVDARDRNVFSPASTIIAAPSGGAAGSSSTITVQSTAGFLSKGFFYLPLVGGTVATVAYTNTTGTTFTGCTGGSGTIAANGSAVKQANCGYGTAAETYWDVVSMDNCSIFEQHYLPNFGIRMTAHAANVPAFWASEGGKYFLAKRTNPNLAQKSLVKFNAASTVGDIEASTANAESCGVVGGNISYTHPTTPNGVWMSLGQYTWVQEDGFAEVLGAGTSAGVPAAGSSTLIAGSAGQVTCLAAGTGPSTTQFRAGNAVGTVSATTCLIKL